MKRAKHVNRAEAPKKSAESLRIRAEPLPRDCTLKTEYRTKNVNVCNEKQTKTSEARVSGMRLWNKEEEKNQIFLKEATSSATLGAKAGDLTPVSPVQEWLSIKGAGRMPWHQ